MQPTSPQPPFLKYCSWLYKYHICRHCLVLLWGLGEIWKIKSILITLLLTGTRKRPSSFNMSNDRYRDAGILERFKRREWMRCSLSRSSEDSKGQQDVLRSCSCELSWALSIIIHFRHMKQLGWVTFCAGLVQTHYDAVCLWAPYGRESKFNFMQKTESTQLHFNSNGKQKHSCTVRA